MPTADGALSDAARQMNAVRWQDDAGARQTEERYYIGETGGDVHEAARQAERDARLRRDAYGRNRLLALARRLRRRAARA